MILLEKDRTMTLLRIMPQSFRLIATQLIKGRVHQNTTSLLVN